MDGTQDTKMRALDWLLEEDTQNPNVRYLALKQLLGRAEDDPQVMVARQAAYAGGPIAAILDQQDAEGFWALPGPGYLPKYRSTVWQIIFLAQLGADCGDDRVRRGCDYLLSHTIGNFDGFSMTATPSGAIHCLQGNLAAALLDLGMDADDRLQHALEWMACSVTGDPYNGQPIRYYRSGISGPDFHCSANNHQPCAWGAVKVALALAHVPSARRTPAMQKAAGQCTDFLLSTDPAGADYPHAYAPKPSTSWFKFGFPVFYITDVLQILEGLLGLGLAGDARLLPAIQLLEGKQDEAGRWPMEYTYNGKTWVDIEQKKQPSKWVTLRALRVLKAFYRE
ncbi:MAG: hypothetical protein PWQ55_1541 [Chloroflexota bacterium]|nr:hypothetical protein [Chloroflexota bacterium]